MSVTGGAAMRDMSWDEAASTPRARREPVGLDAVYAEHVRRMDSIAARIERIMAGAASIAKGGAR